MLPSKYISPRIVWHIAAQIFRSMTKIHTHFAAHQVFAVILLVSKHGLKADSMGHSANGRKTS